MITDINQLDLSKKYTYQDYLTWKFDDMVELIRGRIFKMSPAPSFSHQQVSSNLHGSIYQYLKNKKCRVFHASFDVRLPLPLNQQTSNKIDTVVQPDICVICDETKLDNRGCLGAPDWVIEILSKSTSKKDLTEKFDIYEHAGVREYWLVSPYLCTVTPYVLGEDGQYELVRQRPFLSGEALPVSVFPDFKIAVDDVFLNV